MNFPRINRSKLNNNISKVSLKKAAAVLCISGVPKTPQREVSNKPSTQCIQEGDYIICPFSSGGGLHNCTFSAAGDRNSDLRLGLPQATQS